MEFILLDFFVVHPLSGYALVFFGMLVEGDIVLFTAAFLGNFGVFSLSLLAIIAFVGVIAGDILWYLLGTHQDKLPPRARRIIERVAAPFDRNLLRRPLRTLFITKFAYGIHHLVLARAGADNLGLRRFIASDLVATAGWVTAIMGLGYLGSFALVQVKEYLRFAEVGLLLGLVALFLLERAAKRFSRRRAPDDAPRPPTEYPQKTSDKVAG